MHALSKRMPDTVFYGIGGDAMAASGLRALYHSNNLAFLGFTEVVKHLPFIARARNTVAAFAAKNNITTAILIDYPGFNLSLARKLHNQGVSIVYYISPQLWAWGRGRINKIKRLVAKMLVVFPFEAEMYRKVGISAVFVGHPLVEKMNRYPYITREALYQKYGIAKGKELLLLMPGSRRQEVSNLLPPMLAAARQLAAETGLHPVIATAPGMAADAFAEAPGEFTIAAGNTYDFMKYAAAGIIKSGTSTLEAGLHALPMVIVYKTSALTYRIGKRLVRIANIGLANIVAGETVVPELIQDAVTPGAIAGAVRTVLQPGERRRITEKFTGLKQTLGSSSASENAAREIQQFLESRERD